MTRWLTPEEDKAWRAYRRMRAVLDLAINRDLHQDSGLSDADYDVLSTLTEAEGDTWRAGELATRLLWSTSRLAHQVGRMERRGLVQRTTSERDARGAHVALTNAGRELLATAARRHVASVRRNFIDLLTAGEVKTLERIATKVLAAAQKS